MKFPGHYKSLNTRKLLEISLRDHSQEFYIGVGGFLSQEIFFQKFLKAAFEKSYPTSSLCIVQWEAKRMYHMFGYTGYFLLCCAFILRLPVINVAYNIQDFIASIAMVILCSLILIKWNPWTIACRNADRAGRTLGHYLIANRTEHQSVVLIGYSLGVRVILSALDYLEQENAGDIVDDVYFLAGAVATSDSRLQRLTYGLYPAVRGNIVNIYSNRDFILKYLYCMMNLWETPIGITALQDQRIKNFNFTQLVGGHFRYITKMTMILKALPFLISARLKPFENDSAF
jgi:hypothetical protein